MKIPSQQQPILVGNQQKSVYDIDIDALEEKPWRKAGADITDYFNYGFTEETWKSYCQKQVQLRLEQSMQGKIKVYESKQTDQKPELPPEFLASMSIPTSSQIEEKTRKNAQTSRRQTQSNGN